MSRPAARSLQAVVMNLRTWRSVACRETKLGRSLSPRRQAVAVVGPGFPHSLLGAARRPDGCWRIRQRAGRWGPPFPVDRQDPTAYRGMDRHSCGETCAHAPRAPGRVAARRLRESFEFYRCFGFDSPYAAVIMNRTPDSALDDSADDASGVDPNDVAVGLSSGVMDDEGELRRRTGHGQDRREREGDSSDRPVLTNAARTLLCARLCAVANSRLRRRRHSVTSTCRSRGLPPSTAVSQRSVICTMPVNCRGLLLGSNRCPGAVLAACSPRSSRKLVRAFVARRRHPSQPEVLASRAEKLRPDYLHLHLTSTILVTSSTRWRRLLNWAQHLTSGSAPRRARRVGDP